MNTLKTINYRSEYCNTKITKKCYKTPSKVFKLQNWAQEFEQGKVVAATAERLVGFYQEEQKISDLSNLRPVVVQKLDEGV